LKRTISIETADRSQNDLRNLILMAAAYWVSGDRRDIVLSREIFISNFKSAKLTVELVDGVITNLTNESDGKENEPSDVLYAADKGLEIADLFLESKKVRQVLRSRYSIAFGCLLTCVCSNRDRREMIKTMVKSKFWETDALRIENTSQEEMEAVLDHVWNVIEKALRKRGISAALERACAEFVPNRASVG
jgi:hypothetical protein